MKEQRVFRGVWIPAEIWFNEELEIIEKVMLIEIDSLDNEFGCIATNQYFATFFKRSVNRVSQIISKLFDLGYLHISYANDSRRTIKTTDKYKSLKGGLNIFKGGEVNAKGGTENAKGGEINAKGGEINAKGGSVNGEPNSNTSNNTFNNTFSVSVENTPTQEISNENLNSQNNTLQKVAPKSFPKEICFEDSIYQDFDVFSTFLLEMNINQSDIQNIYKKISLNAKSKNLLKKDWKAYIELWINNDLEKGSISLSKAKNPESGKNDTSIFDERQREIIRKTKIIYQDFLEGVFNSSQLLDSAIEGLRNFWKEANAFNRELIGDIVSKMKNFEPENELETIHKQPEEKEKNSIKGVGSRMREKFGKQT